MFVAVLSRGGGGGSRERNYFLMEKEVGGTAAMTKHCGKYRSAAAPSCVSMMNIMQATQRLRNWKPLCREQIWSAAYADMFWGDMQPHSSPSVAGFNSRTVPLLTSRGRQMAKGRQCWGSSPLVQSYRVRIGRNGAWNGTAGIQRPRCHSQDLKARTEGFLLFVRKTTNFHSKIWQAAKVKASKCGGSFFIILN